MYHLKVVGPHSASFQQKDVSFAQWLAGFGKKAKTYGGLTLLSAAGTLLYPLLSKHVPYKPELILPVACIIQVAVILGLLSWLTFIRRRNFAPTDKCSDDAKAREACGFEDPDEWAKAKNDAWADLSRYWNFWMFLFTCLLMQYALLTLSYLPVTASQKSVLVLFITLINNCVAVAFLCCYFILSKSDALSSQDKHNREEKHWLWIATLIVLTVVEAGCMGLVPENSQPNSFNPEYISTVFMCISGIVTSVAMGFFISRLASKELACPAWLLIMLYIYMAIQPLFVVFGIGNPWGTVIIANIALLLKVLLCLYMVFLFENGHLLFYLVRIRCPSNSVDAQMKHFTSILEN